MNFNKIKLYIYKIKRNSLTRDTLWVTLARVIRIFIQAAYFIIIARALGVQQYGAFVGVTSLISILAPFAGWGSDHILVRNVSRERNLFAESWGNALIITLVSSLIFLVFILFNFSALLPPTIPFLVVFFVTISDLVFDIVLRLTSRAFQAVQNLKITAQLNILPSLTRLMAALCLITFFSKPKTTVWAGLYMIGTIVAALIGLFCVRYFLGKPKLSFKNIKQEIIPGFYFAASMSSIGIYNHIDKTMLARFSTLEATGIYAAAYRLIEVSFVPIASLVFASYPNFFKHGERGICNSVHFALKLLPVSVIYSLLIALAVYAFAPIIPYVLGEEYYTAIEALRWLALLPFIQCLHALGGNTLTGADLQGIVTSMRVGIAVFNIVANLWLIPLYSWKGAVWSTLASDGLLALSCWLIITWYYCKDRKGEVS